MSSSASTLAFGLIPSSLATGLLVFLQVLENDLRWRCKRFVLEDDFDVTTMLRDNRWLHFHLTHCPERRVQSLAHIFVRWIGELIDEPDNSRVPREPFVQNVFWCDVSG